MPVVLKARKLECSFQPQKKKKDQNHIKQNIEIIVYPQDLLAGSLSCLDAMGEGIEERKPHPVFAVQGSPSPRVTSGRERQGRLWSLHSSGAWLPVPASLGFVSRAEFLDGPC